MSPSGPGRATAVFHYVFFGDRYRWSLLLASAVLLACLCLYGHRLGVERHARHQGMLAQPEAYAGKRIDVSYGVVRDVNPRETTLSFKTRWVNVRPRIPDARLGDVVSIEGSVAADTSLYPVLVHIHRGQRFKLHISIAALAVFAVLFFRMYRWDSRALAFRERGNGA